MRPVTWLLIAAFPIAAIAEPIACPQLLPGVRVTIPPDGWAALAPTPARLTEGGLLAGAPERQAYLRGDDKRTRDGFTSSSRFAPGEERWLWCGYGGTGAIQIAKRLPDAATVCTVTNRKTDGAMEIRADCR